MLPGDDGDGSGDGLEDALDGFDEASPEESELGPETPSVAAPDYENRFPESTDEDLAGSLSDLHPDTARAFIVCVILANAALLLVSLGAMLAYFRGMVQIGGGMILLGLFAGLRTYMQYADWRERYEDRTAADDDDDATDADDPDDADADEIGADADADDPDDADETDDADADEIGADADADEIGADPGGAPER